MSKKTTPCEKLGYKVGDKFTVIKDSYLEKGTIVALSEDDGSEVPWFTCGDVRRPLIIGSNPDVEPTTSKLKPAKQALADAIHRNGGWRSGANWACQHGLNRMVVFSASGLAPTRNAARGMACWNSGAIFFGGFQFDRKLPNWHQCILSRDEYFTAYPEQVMVEIKNETEQKVEVEMKSESEATINAGDWHKNGGLPPVGEVVMLNSTNPNDYWAHHVGAELTVVAHDKDSRGVGIAVYRFVDADGYSEYHGLVAHAFMPLRTERDKAIDEMVGEFINYYGDPKGGERYLGIATKLYDSGYRKEVK